MKALWITLGVLFTLCVVCGVASFMFGRDAITKGIAQSEAAQKQAIATVEKIRPNWNLDPVVASASPLFLQSTNREMIAAMGKSARERLGPIKSVGEPVFQGYKVNSGSKGNQTRIDYNIPIVAEKGNATIRVNLVPKNDSEWLVEGFVINSPLMVDNPKTKGQ